MATGIKQCKICGKDYEACHTNGFVSGAFRWQDVACCPEHGSQYLERVLIARGKMQAPVADTKQAEQEDKSKTSPKRSKKR